MDSPCVMSVKYEVFFVPKRQPFRALNRLASIAAQTIVLDSKSWRFIIMN